MAIYKVWLTVKDSYGNTKKIDGGNINVKLDETDITTIEQAISLSDYVKKGELSDVHDELDKTFATDTELEQQLDKNTVKYGGFFDDTDGGSN